MKKILLVLITVFWPCWAVATSPEDFYNAGLDLMKQKDYEKAVQYFRAAVDLRPDYWQAYQFLGEAYFQAANRTEAVVAIEESLRLHPNNPELRKFMKKIRKNSPWVSSGSFLGILSIVSLVVSSLTLAWTLYWSRRLRANGSLEAR